MKPLRIPDTERSFGQAIRWAREQRRLTLRQLGQALDLSAPFLCDIEHDRRETSRVKEFAEALGVALEDLERRQGWTEDLQDWLSRQPKLLALLRDIRARRCSPLVLKEKARKRDG